MSVRGCGVDVGMHGAEGILMANRFMRAVWVSRRL